MPTLTITSAHRATLDNPILARAGEMGVAITVNVDATVQALAVGKYTYLDFIQPNGEAYYKGDYDASSGSFGVTLGSSDTIITYEGKGKLQLVIRDAADETATVIWKSDQIEYTVYPSPNATIPASVSIVPPLTMPSTYPAENVTLADAGGLITATNVEDAFQEIVTNIGDRQYAENYFVTDSESLTESIDALDIGLGEGLDLKMNLAGGSTNPFTAMPYVGTAPIVESGSNANGSYIKYADGTMICRHALAASSAANVIYGNIFTTGSTTWTFPVEFNAAPDCSVCEKSGVGDCWGSLGTGATTTTTTTFRLNRAATSADTPTASLIAIGRWKA